EASELASAPTAVFIRVNALRSEYFAGDLDAVVGAPVAGLIVPKLGTRGDLLEVAGALEDRERPLGLDPVPVFVGIETVAGVHFAAELLAASPRVCAVYFGAEDFASDLGARRTPEGTEVLYARSQVVIAARLAGTQALDQIVAEIRDDERFRADAAMGRNLGYTGKVCVHPRQAELANEIFRPSPEEVERSRQLLAAYHEAEAAGRATIDFEGQMVDGPLVARAQAIVDAAAQLDSR
ncbi:MAG TPA: CoA ester lyase, partial [Candidatus Binatia bacterium]|nr:CoA ester lyase [Candidatus Binatia bacterium]